MAEPKSFTKAELEDLARNFDVHDPRYVECPYYDTLKHMREKGADVLRAESYGGYWVAVTHKAVGEAARDWRNFSNTKGVVIGTDKPQKFVPEEYDPPMHSRFRRIMNPFFSREAAKALEPGLRALADRLIDGFIKSGRADLVKEYATPLSNYVFMEKLFGFTPEEAAFCKEAAAHAMFGETPEQRGEGFARVERFARDLMESRRGKPSDGGYIDAIRTGVVGDRAVSDEEAVGNIQLMIVAGGDTAIIALGAMFELLAEKPALRRELRDNPERLPAAIEEMVRLQSPSVAIQRTAMANVDFCGQSLKEGEKLYLLWGSANRDESVFERADEFVMNRPNINDHLAFGAGAHKCIGMWFARTIVGVATERLLSRIPDFSFQPGVARRYMMGQSRGPLNMPVAF